MWVWYGGTVLSYKIQISSRCIADLCMPPEPNPRADEKKTGTETHDSGEPQIATRLLAARSCAPYPGPVDGCTAHCNADWSMYFILRCASDTRQFQEKILCQWLCEKLPSEREIAHLPAWKKSNEKP